jgi:taurine dioxygenase
VAICVTPLTPTLGAEITGIDVLSLTDEDFAALFEAFVAHSVVFVRDQQELTVDQHRSFAQRFGPIHVHPAARAAGVSADDDMGGVVSIHTTADTRVSAGNRWHSDVSCDDQPPQASILQLHEVPPAGGDTLFSSLYAAYEALSPRMKQLLDGLTARHSGETSYRHLFRFDGADDTRWPETDHPVVRRHLDSGRPALFVDREFTESINDLPKEEGRALFEFLLDHVERANFQCRFRWTQNAIAIWDNRCVLHHAMWDYWPHERSGRRISVEGERPLMWQLGVDEVPLSRVGNVVRLTS